MASEICLIMSVMIPYGLELSFYLSHFKLQDWLRQVTRLLYLKYFLDTIDDKL